MVATEILWGISIDKWNFYILTLTLIALIRYVYDTYKSTRAATYFTVVSNINGKENSDETDKLNHLIRNESADIENLNLLYKTITNRYQIVAHMVERNFLNKTLFFENFSGTTLGVWNNCADYVLGKRKEYNNVLYLRRDLEKLALESWLYQMHIGCAQNIKLIYKDAVIISEPTKKTVALVKKRIKLLKRKNLFLLTIKNKFNY